MKSRIRDMTTGTPMRLILMFALPLMLGNVGQQLYMIVDAIIVGQGVGVRALAALGATDWTYWLFLWSMHSFCSGFSIRLAQHFGAKRFDDLRKAVTMSALLSVAIGVGFTLAGLLASRPLLTLLDTPADILDDALSYINTLFIGTLPVMAYNMAAAVLRSLGDSRTPLVAMVIASVVNIGLDLLFVLVFRWGIVGAAAATVIAQVCAFLYCIYAILRVDILRTTRADWRPDKRVIADLMRLGTPLAVQHAIIAVGGMILQSVLNGFGTLFVAGITATNKMYGILESTAIAFGFSMTTYMGQNLGAGKLERIDAGMKAVLGLSVLVSATISAAMIAFGRQLLGLFVSSADPGAPQVLQVGYNYLRIMSIFLLLLYLLHAYRASLQGLGNTMAALLSGIVEFAGRVGVALALPRLVGQSGIYFAEPAAWLGAAVVLVAAYYREVRRLKRRAAQAEA